MFYWVCDVWLMILLDHEQAIGGWPVHTKHTKEACAPWELVTGKWAILSP